MRSRSPTGRGSRLRACPVMVRIHPRAPVFRAFDGHSSAVELRGYIPCAPVRPRLAVPETSGIGARRTGGGSIFRSLTRALFQTKVGS